MGILFGIQTVPARKALFICDNLSLGSGKLREYLIKEEPMVDAIIAGVVPPPETCVSLKLRWLTTPAR